MIPSVIPAKKAGISRLDASGLPHETPAFAGATGLPS